MTFRAAIYRGNRKGYKSLFNYFIRWWDVARYSHVEIVFSDGVSGSSSVIDGGVRFKRIEYDPEKWCFIEINPDLEQSSRQWFTDHEGDGYDWFADIRFMLGFIQHDKKKYMCSEACLTSLGFEEAWRFSPAGAAAILRRCGKILS